MVQRRMCHFSSQQDLAVWLLEQGIDLNLWGQGGAKSVEDLWVEYQKGESALAGDPPLRLVTVVQVLVRRGDAVLVEAEQELGDGRYRRRGQLPSEKISPGENLEEAAVRCLREELGVAPGSINLLQKGPQTHQSKRESASYPGLPARYTFHRMEANVSDLPTHDFWRDNTNFGPGDPVRRHLWSWRVVD